MKKTTWKKAFAMSLLCLPVAISAQTASGTDNAEVDLPRVYIGGGVSINDFGLVGIGGQFPVAGPVLGYVDLGLGSWGGKAGLGATYYLDTFTKGSSLSAGFSRATGTDEAIEVEMLVEPNDKKENVLITYNPVYTLNLKYAYNLPLGKSQRNKCELSVGYSLGLTDESYTVETENVELNKSSKAMMTMLEPGGLILGVKFMFGLGK